ncbi:Sec63 Brl domain-containing protein [Annulohypoxylon maeteangense]|uniref:Sec63 Brl domain-containing protein n=1 Tax=Annulohypoxylon maeteangense TaxID=1927788 RepID=UPI002007280D|nr:Sec63 Brl domain-containing protein [Annulohypoxylon maeteangense]KAI0887304.1 Sec63 Brl domain-containing protein [Annulohypoxylon maeteangense]
MSSEYSYDEQGQFYPFFIFTLTTIVTLPLTYSLLAPSKDVVSTAPRLQTDYKPEHADLIQAQRTAQKRKQRKVKRAIAVVLGWAVMAGMLYLIVTTQRTTAKIWNPYDILGVSESATDKQIKSHYRKLGLKYHPDKAKPDPAKNETAEMLSDKWVDLTKAYQALTDEEVRNNYIQYGHPDGKQSFSIGIALPKFIISDGNGKYVVLVYALLLGVMLPYYVGSWWYGTQRITKEGVLIESANNLFREYSEDMDEGDLVTALSAGKEFQETLKGDKAESGLATIESRILAEGQLASFAGGLSVKDKEKLEDLDGGVRRKVLALLWAYLGRVELDDQALNTAKYLVAPIAQSLCSSFRAISLAYSNTGPILASFYTSQRLIQAVPPNASPLLQLPHFTPAVVKAVEGDSKNHLTVQEFMDQPDATRRSAAVGNGLLSQEQYKTAVDVAGQLPYLRVAKAFFKVAGERFIIPSSLVTLVVKGRFVPPGSTNVPDVDELDLEDIDPAEDDLDALMGRKKAVKDENGKIVSKEESKPVPPPLTFAPYYSREQSPRWHIFLSDSKQGKMAVPPFTFTTFDQPIFTADGKPTFNMQTLKAQFAAPPQAGTYTFVMHVVCDSYVGFDTKMEVTLAVEDASKAAAMAAEDEISEPEEDSLAGQMSALKGGSVAGTTKPKRRKDDDDSEDDDESGTEEEEDDTSETNTDTEPES